MPMSLQIDHVTIAGPELAPLRDAFGRSGLPSCYGGVHSGGVTHMALLSFADGSYLELISSVAQGRVDTPFWPDHIAGGGGPCAWAVRVVDIAAECRRLAARGIPVEGPLSCERRRPDGRRVAWSLAFPGGHPPGAKLPFLIADATPRALRVEPPGIDAATFRELRGVRRVVVAVDDIGASASLFQRAFGLEREREDLSAEWNARLELLADSPVILATPRSGAGWLRERLRRFGESPCAFVLAADAPQARLERFGLQPSRSWCGRTISWFDPAALAGSWLGVELD